MRAERIRAFASQFGGTIAAVISKSDEDRSQRPLVGSEQGDQTSWCKKSPNPFFVEINPHLFA
jgi:hypothetical protein